MTPPTVGEWERYWTLIMYLVLWLLRSRSFVGNNAILSQHLSHSMFICLSDYLFIFRGHLSEIRFKIRPWAWGWHGFTQVFIVYLHLQYYTAKYDFETDFGDWSKHWKMTESEWERYQIFVNYFYPIYAPPRSTYANLIEKTLKEVPMTTLQVRRLLQSDGFNGC